MVNNGNKKKVSELKTNYESRASFHGKALILDCGNIIKLQSYDTIVAEYNNKDNTLKVNGWFSTTTARHINEFLVYFGFDAITKEEMEEKPVLRGA
jgi:hypothetical protein